jgi:hypothetical protein
LLMLVSFPGLLPAIFRQGTELGGDTSTRIWNLGDSYNPGESFLRLWITPVSSTSNSERAEVSALAASTAT